MNIFKAKSQLEEDMLDRAGKKMAQEIDSEIISNLVFEMLTKDGWTPTKVNPAFTDMGMLSGRFEDWYSQTGEWCCKNAQGEYRLLKGQWLFKDPRDATMFILRWL
jgi:hypothetical protein